MTVDVMLKADGLPARTDAPGYQMQLDGKEDKMAKKNPELQIEQAREEMAVAHKKKLEAIDRVAGTARSAENTMYDKKMHALHVAAERAKVGRKQVSEKGAGVAERAGEFVTTVTEKASDVSDAISEQAGKLGEQAGKLGEQAAKMGEEAVERAGKIGEKAAERAGKMGEKAVKRAGKMGEKAADRAGKLGEKAAEQAGKMGEMAAERAGEIRTKASKRAEQSPWIVAVAAIVLLLALGISIGRRYFSEV